MSYETLIVQRDGNILEITLNRPKKLNALSRQLLDDLRVAIMEEGNAPDVSVVVIKAAGDVFTVGYDVTPDGWIFDEYPADMETVDAIQDHEDIRVLLHYWIDLWKFSKPIIAQVQGMCLSGGNELLAGCDLVVASERAQFGHPAGRDLGIPPTVFLWPMLIGMRKTREMLYTAKSLDAREAHRMGLVNHVVEHAELDAFTSALAADVARTPLGHLQVLKRATSVFYENMGMFESWETGAALDALFHQSSTFLEFFGKVQADGLGAALAERHERYEA
jgi:enoyl-CoA hydratase